MNPEFLWIADSKDHTIKLIYKVVGISHYSGFNNGDAIIATFNNPSSLVLFNSTNFPENKTLSMKIYYSKNSLDCINADYKNYTDCILENLEELKNKNITEKTIDYKLIKMIQLENNNTDTNYDNQFIFVTDKFNHCIRKIDLLTAYVNTYAGKCGEKGFKDGPKGYNRFNEPDNMGIDSDGNLYVYESGNSYIRFIDTNVNGACFEYNMDAKIPNPFLSNDNKMLCLRNWIKNNGKPDEHIFIENSATVCEKNYVECGIKNPLVYDRNKTLYGKVNENE